MSVWFQFSDEELLQVTHALEMTGYPEDLQLAARLKDRARESQEEETAEVT